MRFPFLKRGLQITEVLALLSISWGCASMRSFPQGLGLMPAEDSEPVSDSSYLALKSWNQSLRF